MPELTIVSRKLNELRVSLQPNVETLTDATALRRGGSRARLQKHVRNGSADATALRRGSSRLLLNSKANYKEHKRETPRRKAVASLSECHSRLG